MQCSISPFMGAKPNYELTLNNIPSSIFVYSRTKILTYLEYDRPCTNDFLPGTACNQLMDFPWIWISPIIIKVFCPTEHKPLSGYRSLQVG